MKPWPLDLLKNYPPGGPYALHFPGRPWWQHGSMPGAAAQRNDGLRVDQRGRIFVIAGLPNDADDEYASGNVEGLITALDRDHPMPHPGFRVGQVWMRVERDANYGYQIIGLRPEGFVVAVEPQPGAPALQCYTHHGLAKLLDDAFLLGDTCCSWLAPWAPPEAP